MYKTLLALHLIAVISWMAGILYIYRLFVYHAQETESVVKDRFKVMENRLYRVITVPSMLVATVMGVSLLGLDPTLFQKGWIHAKLFLALGMIGMTLYAGVAKDQLQAGTSTKSHKFFRICNELPTLLLIAIVFLAILKP